MSYDVHWQDPDKHIVYIHYPHNWTWDDYYILLDKSLELINESDQPRVYVIADMSEGALPQGSSQMHALNAMRQKHEKTEFVVLVTQNGLIRFITDMTRRISADMKKYYRVADSVLHAEQLIRDDIAAHRVPD
jgi:hypothetical protein